MSRRQPRDLGFTDNQIRRMVRDQWLHRHHQNVSAVGHARVSDQAQLFAALLSLGARAFLSHRTAGAVWGLRSINVHHVAAGDMERDRVKDAALLRQGITPLRFTDFGVEHDITGILADLRHFLALG